MKTWRELIAEEMARHGESFSEPFDVVLGELEIWNEDTCEYDKVPGSLDQPFYSSYGGAEGCPFTLWTANRVYFPVVYDGEEWVGSAPRNPSSEAASHFGGQ